MLLVNIKYNKQYDVYIGRGSKWENPYSHIQNNDKYFMNCPFCNLKLIEFIENFYCKCGYVEKYKNNKLISIKTPKIKINSLKYFIIIDYSLNNINLLIQDNKSIFFKIYKDTNNYLFNSFKDQLINIDKNLCEVIYYKYMKHINIL